MFLGYRSNDATITITQDNEKRLVKIHEVNAAAEDVLGLKNSEIAGQPLSSMLPDRIKELLDEYVEYAYEGNDVGAVLSKVQSFCMLDSQKKEISFRLKVIRGTPINGADQFKLILQNIQTNRRNEAFRALLRENFKGHEVFDEKTGLPDRNSIAKDIEYVLFYVNKNELKASIAVIEIKNSDSLFSLYGENEVFAAVKNAATIMRRSLRPDDMIGFLTPNRFALILFDTTSESSRMVLNRLRWLMAANTHLTESKKPLALTFGISFTQLHPSNSKEVLGDLEGFVSKNTAKESAIEELQIPN